MRILLTVSVLLALSTIGFALFVKYCFLAVGARLISDTCAIINCTNSDVYDCCPSNGYRAADCHRCHDSTAVSSLTDGRRATLFVRHETIGLCKRKSITCYYDPQDIDRTISVEKEEPGLEIMGLIMLITWLMFLLLVFFLSLYYYLRTKE